MTPEENWPWVGWKSVIRLLCFCLVSGPVFKDHNCVVPDCSLFPIATSHVAFAGPAHWPSIIYHIQRPIKHSGTDKEELVGTCAPQTSIIQPRMHLYPQGRGRTGGVTQSSEWAHLLSHAHAATSAVIQTQQQMSPLQKGPAATSLQSQQQLYVYPQYRVVRSPATQSQQRMHPTPKLQHAYLSSQEQLGSRAVLSQQGRRYSLPHRTVLTSAAQSQQPASHIQSQQIASRQPALHSQQQVDLHSRVRRQSIPDLLQTRRQLIDQLMVQSSGSSPRVIQYRQQQDCQPQPRHNAFSVQQMAAPARTSQALGAQQHRSPSLGAASNAGACIGPQGNVDLSSNRRGVYPLDNSNYNLKLRRYLQAYSDAGSPRACSDSLSESMICSPASTGRNQPSNPEVRDFTFISQSPRLSHPSHAEPRVRSPTLDAAAEDDIKVGECGGYAVDHEAFPRIIAVHSAGAHKKASGVSGHSFLKRRAPRKYAFFSLRSPRFWVRSYCTKSLSVLIAKKLNYA